MLGDGPAWVRQKGSHCRKITPPVIVLSAQIRLVPLPPLPLELTMKNHRGNHHVKDGGGYRISLFEALADLERCAVIVPRSGHNGEGIPALREDPLHLQAGPIHHDNIHVPLPIKCVIVLP